MESRWRARFSAPVQNAPGGHPASDTMGTGSSLGVKRAGRGVDNPPYLAPRLKKSRAIPLPPSNLGLSGLLYSDLHLFFVRNANIKMDNENGRKHCRKEAFLCPLRPDRILGFIPSCVCVVSFHCHLSSTLHVVLRTLLFSQNPVQYIQTLSFGMAISPCKQAV